jgi:hypothetical protein
MAGDLSAQFACVDPDHRRPLHALESAGLRCYEAGLTRREQYDGHLECPRPLHSILLLFSAFFLPDAVCGAIHPRLSLHRQVTMGPSPEFKIFRLQIYDGANVQEGTTLPSLSAAE